MKDIFLLNTIHKEKITSFAPFTTKIAYQAENVKLKGAEKVSVSVRHGLEEVSVSLCNGFEKKSVSIRNRLLG